jgi:predicted signal transduction protein with EAL and GGDEF domain
VNQSQSRAGSGPFARQLGPLLASRLHIHSPEVPMSFSLYMIGYIVLIVGLAIAAHLLRVPPTWIGVGVICMIGIGILTGVTSTKQRDPSQ